MKDKIFLQIRMPKELSDWLSEQAIEENRSKNGTIVNQLLCWMKAEQNEKARREATQQALDLKT